MLQQRETAGARPGGRLNDHARAREAAQRLFGLRLDAKLRFAWPARCGDWAWMPKPTPVLARSERQAGAGCQHWRRSWSSIKPMEEMSRPLSRAADIRATRTFALRRRVASVVNDQ